MQVLAGKAQRRPVSQEPTRRSTWNDSGKRGRAGGADAALNMERQRLEGTGRVEAWGGEPGGVG